jgi:hypothetical protein
VHMTIIIYTACCAMAITVTILSVATITFIAHHRKDRQL